MNAMIRKVWGCTSVLVIGSFGLVGLELIAVLARPRPELKLFEIVDLELTIASYETNVDMELVLMPPGPEQDKAIERARQQRRKHKADFAKMEENYYARKASGKDCEELLTGWRDLCKQYADSLTREYEQLRIARCKRETTHVSVS